MASFLSLSEAPKESHIVLSTMHAYQYAYSIQCTAYSLSILILNWNKIFYLLINALHHHYVIGDIKGGVEDTMIEAKAKAKDTKKFQGEGQTLSRPRPRTKDSGASALQKKKGFQKNFSSNLKKKVFKNFFQAKKAIKNFFSGNFLLRKTKNSLRKFSARFLALSNKILTVQKIVLSSSRRQGNFRGLEALRPRPRTSKSVLEAKDILVDSTSGWHHNSKLLLFLLFLEINCVCIKKYSFSSAVE